MTSLRREASSGLFDLGSLVVERLGNDGTDAEIRDLLSSCSKDDVSFTSDIRNLTLRTLWKRGSQNLWEDFTAWARPALEEDLDRRIPFMLNELRQDKHFDPKWMDDIIRKYSTEGGRGGGIRFSIGSMSYSHHKNLKKDDTPETGDNTNLRSLVHKGIVHKLADAGIRAFPSEAWKAFIDSNPQPR